MHVRVPEEMLTVIQRSVAVFSVLLTLCSTARGENSESPIKIEAPSGWGRESIVLPPDFAQDMAWKGVEEIRFAPGMFQPQAEDFFSYAFVFRLEANAKTDPVDIQRELLKYYRGLAVTVLRDQEVDLKPGAFKLVLEQPQAGQSRPDRKRGTQRLVATLDWTEPFVTRRRQALRMEADQWMAGENRFLFVCVSPQQSEAAIWNTLRRMRDSFVQRYQATSEVSR